MKKSVVSAFMFCAIGVQAQEASLDLALPIEGLAPYNSLYDNIHWSADGKVVYADRQRRDHLGVKHSLVQWRKGEGLVALPMPPDTWDAQYIRVFATSPDGRAVIASVSVIPFGQYRSRNLYRWVDGAVDRQLGEVPVHNIVLNAYATPNCGTVVVTARDDSVEPRNRWSYIWTEEEVVQVSSLVPTGPYDEIAMSGISDDGSVCVGTWARKELNASLQWRVVEAKPFKLEKIGASWVVSWLPRLGFQKTFAYGISQDARTVVVQSEQPDNTPGEVKICFITDDQPYVVPTDTSSEILPILSPSGLRWAINDRSRVSIFTPETGLVVYQEGSVDSSLNNFTRRGSLGRGFFRDLAPDPDTWQEYVLTQSGRVMVQDILQYYGFRSDLTAFDDANIPFTVSRGAKYTTNPNRWDPPLVLMSAGGQWAEDAFIFNFPLPPNAFAESVVTGASPTLTVAAPGVMKNDQVAPGTTAELVSPTSGGTVHLNADGSFSYTPRPDFAGTDSFTYMLKKGPFKSATVTTSLKVPSRIASNSLSEPEVLGGHSFRGTVKLVGPAPSGGASIKLTSDGPAVIPSPSSLTIPEGAKGAGYIVKTLSVDTDRIKKVFVTAGGNVVSTSFKLLAARVKTVSLTESSTAGGYPVKGTVRLTGKAGIAGASVALASPSLLLVPPATVRVPPNTTEASFVLQTKPVSTTVYRSFTATLFDSVVTGGLYLVPLNLSVSTNKSSVVEGYRFSASVSLATAAPAGGMRVPVSYPSTVLAGPSSVFVGGGKTSATFAVGSSSEMRTPVEASVVLEIGGVKKKAVVTVTPISVASVSMDKSSVAKGAAATGRVRIDHLAGPEGVKVILSASSGATVPAFVTVPPGQASALISVDTTSVSAGAKVTITASRKSGAVSTSFSVVP